ncbi:unnamed protein product, partial [Prorocentrum cordatum]
MLLMEKLLDPSALASGGGLRGAPPEDGPAAAAPPPPLVQEVDPPCPSAPAGTCAGAGLERRDTAARRPPMEGLEQTPEPQACRASCPGPGATAQAAPPSSTEPERARPSGELVLQPSAASAAPATGDARESPERVEPVGAEHHASAAASAGSAGPAAPCADPEVAWCAARASADEALAAAGAEPLAAWVGQVPEAELEGARLAEAAAAQEPDSPSEDDCVEVLPVADWLCREVCAALADVQAGAGRSGSALLVLAPPAGGELLGGTSDVERLTADISLAAQRALLEAPVDDVAVRRIAPGAAELSRLGGEFFSSLGAQAWAVAVGTRDVDDRFDVLLDLEVFDSLAARDSCAFGEMALAALWPGGLLLSASEEQASYGPLRRTMHALRPAVEPRVAATPVPGTSFALHVFRKASVGCADRPDAGSHPARASAAAKARAAAGRFDGRSLMEPVASRAIPTAERYLQDLQQARAAAAASEAEAAHSRGVRYSAAEESEPPEWISDAVELALLAGRGRGVVAARAVEAGEVLGVSRALCLFPVADAARAAAAWLAEATPRQRLQLGALHDGSGSPGVPPRELFGQAPHPEAPACAPDAGGLGLERMCQIFRFNAVRADRLWAAAERDAGGLLRGSASSPEGGGEVSGIWPLVSLVNHSCLPSACCVPLTRRTVALVATRPLPAGAEVTQRYLSPLAPRGERQAELRRAKGFDCGCARCVAELEALPAELARRLAELQARAAEIESEEGLLEALRRLAAVAREELEAAADRWLRAASRRGVGAPEADFRALVK